MLTLLELFYLVIKIIILITSVVFVFMSVFIVMIIVCVTFRELKRKWKEHNKRG